jgi:hypothetical protein
MVGATALIPGVGSVFIGIASGKLNQFRQELPNPDDFTPLQDGFNAIKRYF